jgi:beta-lactam-binding protein with PASTA domain
MNNQWSKRQVTTFTCDSGNQVVLRRPGPSLSLKAGRFVRVLNKVGAKEKVTADAQLDAIQKLSDSELEELTEFARVVISDVIVSPVVALNPKEGQYHPDDLPVRDFWQIFMWFAQGSPTMPVKLREGETTVEAVSNFPEGSGSGIDVDNDSAVVS